jgi:hypothetical protein
MLENTDNPIVDATNENALNPETVSTTSLNENVVENEPLVTTEILVESVAAEVSEIIIEQTSIEIEPTDNIVTTEVVEDVIVNEKSEIESIATEVNSETVASVEDVLVDEKNEIVNESVATEVNPETVSLVEDVLVDEKIEEEQHEDGVSLEELIPQENYLALTQKELVAKMQEICNHTDVFGNKKFVKAIREAYRSHSRDMLAANLAKFKEDGGDPKEFEAPENPLDETFNDLQKRFNQKVADENKRQERELQDNLKARCAPIP